VRFGQQIGVAAQTRLRGSRRMSTRGEQPTYSGGLRVRPTAQRPALEAARPRLDHLERSEAI